MHLSSRRLRRSPPPETARLIPGSVNGDGTSRAPGTLSVHELRKRFGDVAANDGLTLEFRTAQVHALLGENGAGKSTLIKTLAGLYQPDSGSILLDGEQVRLENAVAARSHGIGVVHQDSTLVPTMTVLENVVLQEGGLGRISAELGERLVEAGRRLGFALNPRAMVERLTPGDRQRVEIARALMSEARFLILDEPTAVLSPQEKETFFGLLKSLAAEGLGVVVVTHHIGDALGHCERVTVLRAGKVVDRPSIDAAELGEERLIAMMVGGIDQLREERGPSAEQGEEILRVEGLRGRMESGRSLNGISFAVRAGEIMGVAGVEGHGQRELAAALTGAWSPDDGTIEVDGRQLTAYARFARAKLVADVPDDQQLGTVNDISVWENIALTEFAWHRMPTPWQKRRLRRLAADLVSEFDVRTASLESPVAQLSGGNRRRVLLARELSKSPAVAVLAFATKGLDIRSVEQVKAWTRRLAAAGAAVIYISADLNEILSISDRIAVIAGGELQGILDASQADEHRIGRLMLGASTTTESAPA
jgi:general nucleoside transport system ATP-binding protein